MRGRVLLTFDVEECDPCRGPDAGGSGDRAWDVSAQGLEAIRSLTEEHGIRCTFFVTAAFAARYPDRVRGIARVHEVGVHGYWHRHDYARMEEGEARRILGDAKRCVEGVTGKPALGFRAPRLQAPRLRVLSELGFRYDSSLHPTFVPGRYNHWSRERGVSRVDGCYEIPVSVTPRMRLPLTWAAFRLLPLSYSQRGARRAMRADGWLNLYFHSWEFAELEGSRAPYLLRKNTGGALREKLGRYIRWHRRRGNDFVCAAGLLPGPARAEDRP